jgi:hypothetical protein
MAAEDLYLRSLSDKDEVGNPTNLRLRSAAEKIAAKIRNLKVKVGGVWTVVSKVSVKVSGSWVEATLSAKADGSWEVIHEK